MEKLYFVAGLPRSGSTLLCNILCQNPRFSATATSGLSSVIRILKNRWLTIDAHKAGDKIVQDIKLLNVLTGVLSAYHSDNISSVVFDKNREWPNHIETLKKLWDGDVRILVTVRSIGDILASMEMRWRESLVTGIRPIIPNDVNMDVLENRLEYWASGVGLVGAAYNVLKNAFDCGHREYMHIIEFEDFTKYPKSTMEGVYEFLEEKYFEHDFDNVVQITKEDDRVHGYAGLHNIRSKVRPLPMRNNILGDNVKKYTGLDFWNAF